VVCTVSPVGLRRTNLAPADALVTQHAGIQSPTSGRHAHITLDRMPNDHGGPSASI